jgi:hypothetical protein
MGSLKATSIFHIIVDGKESVKSVEQINVGDRIRDLSLGPSGVWYSSDDGQVVLLRFSKSNPSDGMFPKSKVPDHSFISQVPYISKVFRLFDSVIQKTIQSLRFFGL